MPCELVWHSLVSIPLSTTKNGDPDQENKIAEFSQSKHNSIRWQFYGRPSHLRGIKLTACKGYGFLHASIIPLNQAATNC